MKKNLLLTTAFTLAGVIFTTPYLFSNFNGAPAGVTGAPGESTCAQGGCHTGQAVQTNSNAVTIQFMNAAGTTPQTSYKANTKYRVMVTAAKSGAGRFGFQSTVKNASNAAVGTFAGVSGISKIVSSNYATHINADPAASGTDVWYFDWTSPASSAGDITIYTSVNTADGSGSSTNDQIHTKSLTVSMTNSIYESTTAKLLGVYPNPATDNLSATVVLTQAETVQLNIYSLDGKLMKSIAPASKPAGHHTLVAPVQDLEAGVYFVQIQTGSGQLTQKFIKF